MQTQLTNKKEVYDVTVTGTNVKLSGECTLTDTGLQRANLTVHSVNDNQSNNMPGMPALNKGTISYSKDSSDAVTQNFNSLQADLAAEATTLFLQFVNEQNGVSTTIQEGEA